jgi:hypothetical protein
MTLHPLHLVIRSLPDVPLPRQTPFLCNILFLLAPMPSRDAKNMLKMQKVLSSQRLSMCCRPKRLRSILPVEPGTFSPPSLRLHQRIPMTQ